MPILFSVTPQAAQRFLEKSFFSPESSRTAFSEEQSATSSASNILKTFAHKARRHRQAARQSLGNVCQEIGESQFGLSF